MKIWKPRSHSWKGDQMEEILDVAIPAVVLIPIILIGIAVWIGLNYNAKSSCYVRKAEFMKLQRMAAEEHESAERELEQEYSLQRQADPYRSSGLSSQGVWGK